jgi:hypothetical protein
MMNYPYGDFEIPHDLFM